MSFPRKLPIGVQSFKVLRNDRYIYVDKTKYITQLVTSSRVYFLSRPRRFGKSLFLSTLAAYFLGKKELFKGLYLEKAEEEQAVLENRAAWQEYPVFYLDFNTGNYNCMEVLQENLNIFLSRLEDIYGKKDVEETPPKRFEGLLKRAYQKTGKQVVILVDEYDKPLLQTMGGNESLNEQYRNELKAFYSVLKSADQYIRLAFLTGVTKFSKVSIFSDLNNLNDISLTPQFSGICGITHTELLNTFEPEIKALAQDNELSYEECIKTLQQKYDGYCFSPETERMYNPFSLLNVLANSSYGYYWFETATPTYLVNYIKRKQEFIPEFDKDLSIGVNAVQDFRYNDDDAIVPLLFQSGYLTIKKYLTSANLLRLGYPNEEVRFGFLEELIPHYSSRLTRTNIEPTIWNLYEWLNSGNLVDTMKLVEEVLAGILYGNIPNNETGRPLREQYYQSVLYAVFRLLGLHAQSEVVCASGRIDMIVSTRKHIYLFEFKVTTEGSAEDAIAQIKERGYLKKIRATKRPIHLVGVSFDEKSRNIKEWKEEIVEKSDRKK